ncbi:MAG: alanine--tRNA ligase, partial [Ignavibacteriaceae bacterium]|nr:alanine--tRNA ligase [Ignavibacteriaceae bacterium]
EAYELWKTKTDINLKHILKFGEKDNFWEMGETGPCGPCSEIHINVGDDYENAEYVNAGTPQCIEIWNLVFIQYNRDENGKLHELPAKHVDTGMGFERICAVLQNKKSNYDTDIFYPIIEEIVNLSKIKIEKDLSIEAKEKSEEIKIPTRVIADHIRALTFAIADGAVPGNEGRGYVLRRILRRAARYGRKINLSEPFLYKLVDVLIQTMGDIFPEIKEKKEYVQKVIRGEEESFNATLDRGIELFEEIIEKLNKKKDKLIPGEEVFKLYDTFGFPVDLTNIMAIEKGFTIDEVRFNELMNQQKERAREASKEKFSSVNVSLNDTKGFRFASSESTEFTGYNELQTKSKIIGYKRDNDTDFIILNKSPFYVESGGQVDDTGSLILGEQEFDVVDLLKIENKTIHIVENDSGKILQPGAEIIAAVDSKHRWDVMRNHSVTHFLHAALRKILGTHVQQAGSYVGPEHLRFDFTHFTKPSPEELHDIEILVNEQLRRNLPMYHHRNIPFEEAKKMGALMFFGDKYGDKVNVVQFGDFTMEFCGGTHVKNSSEIGLFKITSEASIASGIRRIEAVTGAGVEKYIQSQLEHMKQFSHRIDELLDTKKKLEKEISDLKLKDSLGQLDHIISLHSTEKGIKIYKGKVHADSMDELKSFGDELRNKMRNGVGVLISQIEDKVGIVAVVSDNLIKEKKLSAGKIVGELAKLVGGGGGGRPHLATAGGKDVSGITAAIGKVEKVVGNFL